MTRADQEEKIRAHYDALVFRREHLDNECIRTEQQLRTLERTTPEHFEEDEEYLKLTARLIEIRQMRAEVQASALQDKKTLESDLDARALAFYSLNMGDLASAGGELKRAEKNAAKKKRKQRQQVEEERAYLQI